MRAFLGRFRQEWEFQTVSVKQLLHRLNICGSGWVGKFAYGFPIAGPLSRKFPFPRGKKKSDRLHTNEIFASSSARLRGRAAKSGMKNADPLRADAVAQAQEGRLLYPIPLSPGGKPLLWSPIRSNFSFRFGVLQAERLLACDDSKHSMANLTCAVETPIQLLSWYNIAQISTMLADGGGDCMMFKADHKAAYKKLPIDPDDQNTAIIALRRPTPTAAGTVSSLGLSFSAPWPLSSTITFYPGSW